MQLALHLFKCLVLSSSAALASPSSSKWLYARDPCTPLANGYEMVDDSPAINDAIKTCGKGGTIVLPADQVYSIRSPINFSPCNHCELQIEGTLLIARGQWSYWQNVDSTFTIANVTGLRIRSVTGSGVVDGNAIEYYTTRYDSGFVVTKSFAHITNGSSDIVIENLRMKNVMHRFIRSEGWSHNITIRNLTLTMEQQWGYYPRNQYDSAGIELGQTFNISISDIRMNFTTQYDKSHYQNEAGGGTVGTCLAIDRGVHNVTATGITCQNAFAGAILSFESIGNLPKAIDGEFADTASNIHISDLTFSGMCATGSLSFPVYPQLPEHISDVTWSNVTVLEGRWGFVNWCWLKNHSNTPFPVLCANYEVVHVRDMEWRDFRGVVGKRPNGTDYSSWTSKVNETSTLDYRFGGYWDDTTVS